MPYSMLWLCCILLLWPGCHSLRVPTTFGLQLNRVPVRRKQSSSEATLMNPNLTPLSDHARMGSFLSKNIALWLDNEYIVQAVHAKIGNSVDLAYQKIRALGLTDLTDMLLEMGQLLEGVDMENAFVNAWDVANKASELLLGQLHEHEVTSRIQSEQVYSMRVGELASNFARYRLLQGYLEGEVPYGNVHPALAALLGFRFFDSGSDGGRVLRQDPELAPPGWEGLSAVPVFEAVDDKDLQDRLVADLPEDESSLDAVLEVLMGHESYAQSKSSPDPPLQRRVLIAKWMYLHGFLNVPEFPPRERYVPPHQREPEEDADSSNSGSVMGSYR